LGQIAKRNNAEGADRMRNRQYTHSHRAQPLLSAEQLADLAQAVRGPAPEGDEWLGRTVAAWMSQKLGRRVSVQLGWVYLVKLEGKRRKPRPRHVQADPVAQEQFKKTSACFSVTSPQRSRTPPSSSGRSTNTASA
jgi:Winged helix-turn helix